MVLNKKLLIIPVVLIFALIIIRLATYESKAGDGEVFVSGTIEITTVDVSFKVPGRLIERFVSEGIRVKPGQEIAILDNVEMMQEVQFREAELLATQSQLLEVSRGYLPEEIAQSRAKLSQAEAEYDRLQSDYLRQKKLLETDVISPQEFDAIKSLYEMSKAKVNEAKENYQLLKKGFREEKIDQAEARVKMAKEALNLAKTRLSQTLIQAPILGFVISENVEAGEVVAAGTPIVTIGDLEKVWLRAYIAESDLGKVKLGQEVKIFSDSYPGKIYLGKVSFISPQAEFTPKNVQTEKERVKLVYRIKIDIKNPHYELKPGMPVEGLIDVDS